MNELKIRKNDFRDLKSLNKLSQNDEEIYYHLFN